MSDVYVLVSSQVRNNMNVLSPRPTLSSVHSLPRTHPVPDIHGPQRQTLQFPLIINLLLFVFLPYSVSREDAVHARADGGFDPAGRFVIFDSCSSNRFPSV